jgi:hypothetical protein
MVGNNIGSKDSALIKYKLEKIVLIYEEIQKSIGTKSYMRKGCLILYMEMREYLFIAYEKTVSFI